MSFKFTSAPALPSLTRRKAIASLAAAHAMANKTPSLILPRLYLSGYTIAAEEQELIALGITHVVSVLEFPPEYEGSSIKTLHIKIEDSFRTDILQHLDITTEFIKTALDENDTNKVLVHCLMGISRSATVVSAYLVATAPMTAPEAIAFVTERRSIVSPNIGFQRQLEAYALRFCTEPGKTKRPARLVSAVAQKVMSYQGRKEKVVTEESMSLAVEESNTGESSSSIQ